MLSLLWAYVFESHCFWVDMFLCTLSLRVKSPTELFPLLYTSLHAVIELMLQNVAMSTINKAVTSYQEFLSDRIPDAFIRGIMI